MYEAHFGLKEKPFSITPDSDFLYLSDTHQQALLMLEYGVFEQSGITVITGDVGTGKTTLIRHLLTTIPYDKITVALISNVHKSLGNLLQWVSLALDIDTSDAQRTNQSTFREIQDFLVREYADGKRVVLIIDEAQNMGEDSLEELRMLLNINADKNQLLHIVLVGQSELFDILLKPTTRQIAQRVTAEYHLRPLSLSETKKYIQERLSRAGAIDQSLFTENAAKLVFYFSNGVPRLINTLCDHALVLAYGSEFDTVDYPLILDTIKEKRIGGRNRFHAPDAEAEAIRNEFLTEKGLDICATEHQ